MTNFKEHDGVLFKMLEEPVPLTPDAKMPVLVRLIQDDSPMGRLNKRNYDESLNKIECATGYNKMLKMPFNNMPFAIEKFEILGTFVEEGSDDWAWYQMMQGEKISYVGMISKRFYAIKKGCDYCAFYESDGNEVSINTRRTYDEFIEYSKRFGISSWQIYKEPELKYKVGDWVEVKETATGEIEHHTVERINTFCPVSPEYLVDDVWFNHDGMEIIPLDCMFNHRRITRKLSPSEVVIDFGSTYSLTV